MDQTSALRALRRFGGVITRTARQTVDTFGYPLEFDDVQQEAGLLVLSYSGLIKNGRLPGKLREWEQVARGDDAQVKRLLASQLHMDLNQKYARDLDRGVDETPSDQLPESSALETYASHDVNWSDYPYLTRHYRDGMTSKEIAEDEGVDRSTITRRITKEKHHFLTRYLTKAGLIVEGDESLAELTEAYGYLKEAGR